MEEQPRTADPRELGPKPPFPIQATTPPGSERSMLPRADHGEETYRGSGRLQGRVALITGGDSGIGKAVAIAYAREGADVAIAYLDEHDDALDTQRLVQEAGARSFLLPGDLGDEQHCNDVVRRTIDELGGLDILVNNAARQQRSSEIDELTAAELEAMFRANVYSMFFLTRAAWPHLRPSGAVINTTSIQAYRPSPSLLAYASTKGAMVSFTRALAQQGIERGIRVNAVAPGPVWTPLIVSSSDAEANAEFGAQNPEGRPAQPAELAHAYVFLAASLESSYVNGEVLGVHGGTGVPT